MTTATIDLKADLRDVIERAIINHPRSQQKMVGPSGLGTPCTRKLGHRIAQTPRATPEIPAWRPTAGTAIHWWAERTFQAENAILGWERWLTEVRVFVGEIDGQTIVGSCDLYDRLTRTAIDWKFPGVTTIKQKRAAKHPGPEYRVQAHTYGLGLRRFAYNDDAQTELADESFLVEHVAIYFLPAAGELGDGYFWTEPYDAQIALDAMAKADALGAALRVAGPAAILPQLPTAPDYCAGCAWWQPGATDLTKACPGDPDMEPPRQAKPALTAFTPGA